jgi:hypothetical protein
MDSPFRKVSDDREIEPRDHTTAHHGLLSLPLRATRCRVGIPERTEGGVTGQDEAEDEECFAADGRGVVSVGSK